MFPPEERDTPGSRGASMRSSTSGRLAGTAALLGVAQADVCRKADVRPVAGAGEEERRWRSVYGAVVGAQCHRPAEAALVAGWEGEAEA